MEQRSCHIITQENASKDPIQYQDTIWKDFDNK